MWVQSILTDSRVLFLDVLSGLVRVCVCACGCLCAHIFHCVCFCLSACVCVGTDRSRLRGWEAQVEDVLLPWILIVCGGSFLCVSFFVRVCLSVSVCQCISMSVYVFVCRRVCGNWQKGFAWVGGRPRLKMSFWHRYWPTVECSFWVFLLAWLFVSICLS